MVDQVDSHNVLVTLPNGEDHVARINNDLEHPPDESDDPTVFRKLLRLPDDYPTRRMILRSDIVPELIGVVAYAIGIPALWDWQQGPPECPWTRLLILTPRVPGR